MFVRRKLLISSMLVGTILLTGCGPEIKLAEYAPAHLSTATVLPSQSELEGKKPKVVVLAVSDTGSSAARNAKAGDAVTTKIDSIISTNKSIEVVDRSAAAKLQDEVRLIELNKKSKYSGPAIADFVISGNISTASSGSRFTEASTYCDKKGRCYTTPASCTYSGSAGGILKVYGLPGLKVVHAVDLQGSSSFSSEGYCRSNYDANGLISQAGANAGKNAKVKLLNFFSPKGYITEKRAKGSESIFLAQFGTEDGVKFNDNVKIYTVSVSKNPLTGKESKQEVFLADAKVTNQLTQNTSWVLVEDATVASQIKLGDFVKIEYKRGFMDTLQDAISE